MTPALAAPAGRNSPAFALPSLVSISISCLAMMLFVGCREINIGIVYTGKTIPQPAVQDFVLTASILQLSKGRHVKGLHLRRIAIIRAVRTCIAVETAAGPAGLAARSSHMAKAGLVGKTQLGIGIDRTGFHAGFVSACVAEVNRFVRFGEDNLFEQKRAAIGMPEPVLRM